MIKVFPASRIGAKTKKGFEKNLNRMRAFARFIILHEGYEPEPTALMYCQFLDDFNPKERELGMERGRMRLLKCGELWILKNEDGTLSPGMQKELEAVEKHNQDLVAIGDACQIKLKSFLPKKIERWLKANDVYGYKLWLKSK